MFCEIVMKYVFLLILVYIIVFIVDVLMFNFIVVIDFIYGRIF